MVSQVGAVSASENQGIRSVDALTSLTRSRNDAVAAQVAQLVPPQEMAAYLSAEQPVRLAATSAQATATGTQTTPPVRDLALLAADVYNDVPNPPAGYRVATATDLATLGLRPSDLTSAQSPFRARVYVTGPADNPQYVVSFRGTAEGGDWRANFRQGVGLSTDHYSKALHIGRQLARASNADVVITGHSLGGGLASAAAIASGRQAATFNSAGLSDNTIDAARAIHQNAGVTTTDRVDAYYVRGEILSALQDGGDRFVGGLLGGLLGAAVVDAPEAYGNRIRMDAVRPEGLRWYQDNPVSRHGMDWVLSSVGQ